MLEVEGGVDDGTRLEVLCDGRVLLTVGDVREGIEPDVPRPAVEPGLPNQIETIDELVHLARSQVAA